MARTRKTRPQAQRTSGHSKFVTWRNKLKKSNQELAELLDVNPSQVSRWTTTTAKPDLPQIMILEHVAKIPCGAWLSLEEHVKVIERIEAFGYGRGMR